MRIIARMIVRIAAFMLLLAAAPAAMALSAPESEGDADDQSADADDVRAISSSEDYVRMDPVMSAVRGTDGRVRGLLHVEMGLEAADPELRALIGQRQGRLRDAYVSAMAIHAAEARDDRGPPDVERLSGLLQSATDRALGRTGATVMLGMVMIHDQ